MASISVPRKDPKALTSYLRSVPPNQLAQALSFLEETKVPLNTIHCNVILAAHARSKNWSAALQLLNRLPQMKIQADVVSFNSAISARAMWFAALHLLKRMQSSKIIPDIFTFNSLISVCGSAAQWQQALASFEMMTAQRCLPDAITSSALVNAGASALLWEQATSLAFRIEASTASHNAVAKSLASSSWPRAAQLMCRMRQQQLDPNEITSGAAATATGSGGSWHQVLLISPRNEVWFGGLIAGSQPWPLAAHFLGMMELEQLQINEICYSACLGACAKGGAWNFAMKMFGAMPANALQQDEIAYSNVLSQSWESALGTLAMLQLGGAEANLICCSATTASCSKSQFWQQSAGLFSWIQDKKVLPNIISCNSVLSGCSWEAAQQLLDTLPLMHLESDFASYTALLTSLRSSQWELAVRAISDMSGLEVEVGPTMCNAAITACSKGAQWDMALHLLNAMPIRRIAPTAVSHCSVIDGCEAAGELDIAKEVLQSMIANGFDVTSLMWALGRLAMKDVSLIGACLSRASRLLLSDCSPKEVSILAWSCCILGVRSNLQCRLGREALERIQNFETDDLLRLAWGLPEGSFSTVLVQERAAHLLKMTLERDGASNGTLQLVEDVLGIVWSSAFSRCLNPYCLAKIHGLLRDLGRLLDGVVHVGDRPARTLVKSAEVPKILMDLSDRLVVFKPPGWEVHNQNVPLQLSDFLQAEVPLGPVADDVQHHHGFLHRLDVPSSGLILVAKTYSAYYDLQVQLNSGDIQRDYLALCHGWMPSLEEIAAAVQVIEDSARILWMLWVDLGSLGYQRDPKGYLG